MLSRLLVAALVALSVTACASTGGVATPKPFPGAPTPPTGAPEPPPVVAATPPPPAAVPPPVAKGTSASLIETALGFLGTPYRWGGSDPSGFDCSGFVQWVFSRIGAALPREVREQYRAGRPVDDDEVRPGDLVFFQTVAKGASHVGIALGNGQFVHAPSSKGVVRIERYTAGYWAQRWVGARRVF